MSPFGDFMKGAHIECKICVDRSLGVAFSPNGLASRCRRSRLDIPSSTRGPGTPEPVNVCVWLLPAPEVTVWPALLLCVCPEPAPEVTVWPAPLAWVCAESGNDSVTPPRATTAALVVV
jgi:hypothetical protein